MTESMKKRLGEMLVDEGIITEEQLLEAMQEQKLKGGRLEKILISQGYVTQDVIMAFVGTQLGIPHVSIADVGTIPNDVVFAVPESLALKYCLLPIARKDTKLTVAMADPLNVFAIDDVKMMTGLEVEPVIAAENEIKEAHAKYFGAAAGGGEAGGDMQEIINSMGGGTDSLEVLADEEKEVDISKLEAAGEEAPVIRLVNLVLTEAVRAGASDIHVEPYEKSLRCRYRIDGVLHEVQSPPKQLSAAIASRIKIMSSLDISERRLPQDGRIKIKVLGKEIDLRVSILPVQYGEKIVMRILDSSSLNLEISKLGFEDEVLPKIEKAITEPYGLMLATGPTGSGKSTTLYSILHHINYSDVNISTAEDPVEYNLPGINQVNTKAAIGLTFAASLRAFLRQDPDIILVGEIRDKETAEIAINAALTGHLVFSTLHTNDAPGAVTRMDNMGVEPFLITSTVHCIIAQRLLRRICADCKEPFEPAPNILEELKYKPASGETVTLYHGTGCTTCSNTGYKGRLAIHEVLIPDEEFRRAVVQRRSSAEIKKIARRGGMMTLRECGVRKILKGQTTVEELLRVAHADEQLD